MTKRRCSKKIWAGRTPGCLCSRPATVERDGKWWCWQHDPERVEADKKKRRARWDAKMDRETAKYERIALGALVTKETAALLERLADYAREAAHAARECPDDVDGAYIAEETARATAASIKEALDDGQA